MINQNKSNYQTDLEKLVVALCLIIEANTGVRLEETDDWKHSAEKIAIKVAVNGLTILDLWEGTKPKIVGLSIQVNFFDYVSMFPIVRSALESYLAYFYLINDPAAGDEEKKFRRLLWHGSYLSNRQRFSKITPAIQNQLAKEKTELNTLRVAISSSQLFNTPNVKGIERKKIAGNGAFDWKPDDGWRGIARKSPINEDLFMDMYNHLSSTSHSEEAIVWHLSNKDTRRIQIGLVSVATNFLNIVLSCFISDYVPIASGSRDWYNNHLEIQKIVRIYKYVAEHSFSQTG